MYSMSEYLLGKTLPKSLLTLVIILPTPMLFSADLVRSHNAQSAKPVPITGDWLYQSVHQMALLHINPDTSYSHIVINFDAPNSSFHHWGRIKWQANVLQFIPSELVFYRQQSLQAQFVAVQSLVVKPVGLPEITTTDSLTHDLITQAIQYSLSAKNTRLTLSSKYGDVNILGQQYQALESHHTFGYWPNTLAVDVSYSVIFPNGYYAQISSSLDPASDVEFLWGKLF